MRIEVLEPEALAARAAVWLADQLWTAVAERGVAHLAVSGGRTPAAMFATLAGLPVPWPAVHVWQVDERVAPDGDPARNLVELKAALLDHVTPGGVHLLDVAAPDLAAAADHYAAELTEACRGLLDVVHLGLGDDGHTASWPPGDPVSSVRDTLVATSCEYQGRVRLTLTVPAVAQARRRLLLVAGASKAEALALFAERNPRIPAHLVPSDDTVVLCDRPAAAGLTPHVTLGI